VTAFNTDATAKRASTMCPVWKSYKSPIFRFYHMDCHSTQSLMHCMSTTSVNKQKKIQWCKLKFFQHSQCKQILFLNFLAFPFFCPPLVYFNGKSVKYTWKRSTHQKQFLSFIVFWVSFNIWTHHV
jgi:hypothetical protein